MIRNQVRRAMFGAIIIMIGLMSIKKVSQALDSDTLTKEIKEVHTVQV